MRTAARLAVVLALAAPATAALASLRLITLDLDDTLWPTGPVVSSANIALATAVGGDPKDLQARLRTARAGTDKPSYSEARVLAIESWLNERDGTASGHRDDAEEFFDLWLAERHAAAGRLLFDGAAEAVAAVRRQHPDALIAAVTNGRGDPLVMPSLRPHFDFTISAEDADIYPERKPAAAPFLAALRRAGVTRPTPALWAHVRRRRHSLHPCCFAVPCPGAVVAGSQGAARGVEASACHPPQPQPSLGGGGRSCSTTCRLQPGDPRAAALCLQVGDDLVNDVQAAKRLGAWAVWLGDAAPADAESGGGGGVAGPASSPDDAVAPGTTNWYSTMGAEEREARVRATEAARGSADATIGQISELPDALSAASRRRGRACPLPGMGS